jgi:hypothetical protein
VSQLGSDICSGRHVRVPRIFISSHVRWEIVTNSEMSALQAACVQTWPAGWQERPGDDGMWRKGDLVPWKGGAFDRACH